MTENFPLPLTTSTIWDFGVFIAAVLILHILFVWIWKLGKVGWKYSDYVWLGMAVIGLLGASSEARRLAAADLIQLQRSRQEADYSLLRERVQFMTGPGVCNTFTRSQFSRQNFDEVQKEYNEVCRFASDLYQSLPVQPPQTLDISKFRDSRPKIKDQVLLGSLSALDDALNRYLASERAVTDMVMAQERTSTEVAFTIVSPFLLAIALALRITKVTGEIRLGT